MQPGGSEATGAAPPAPGLAGGQVVTPRPGPEESKERTHKKKSPRASLSNLLAELGLRPTRCHEANEELVHW